jgi:predicted MPP superfamily phosphohydrolase
MKLVQPSSSDLAQTLGKTKSFGQMSEERTGLDALEQRLGHLYVAQRLGIERDHEAHIFRKGTGFFELEGRYSALVIRTALQLTGLYARGRRNARSIDVKSHDVPIANLPTAFDGFTILQLSDLHIDMTAAFVDTLIHTIGPLQYDLCVLTGDYRARTFGSYEAALSGMRRLRPHIGGAAYAILGNHDALRMVPAMESMGYQFLINEHVKLQRDGEELYLAGIDDAHFYRLQNYHRAAQGIPRRAVSILLSHTPEAYRHAAHAGFDLMLCGHTHGGQICLPGGIPLLTEAESPRRLARGAWRYHNMVGYTSVGAGTCLLDVRLNCRPEVTLHRLRRKML